MQLRGCDNNKISYTKKLFQSLKQGKVHYHVVSSYRDLVDIASSLYYIGCFRFLARYEKTLVI